MTCRLPALACELPTSLFEGQPPLTHTYDDLKNGRPVTIVAIGGASTMGTMAVGEMKMAWPARAAAALSERFPAATVRSVNLGAMRQTAQDMLRRFDADVFKLQPSLVIWETGTAEVVGGVGVAGFRETVQAGIDQLKARNVEVMLMDLQYSPRTLALYDPTEYLNALDDLADANDVPIFHRYEAMRQWSASGEFDFDVADPARQRDVAMRLYDCIGRGVVSLIGWDGKKVEATFGAPRNGQP